MFPSSILSFAPTASPAPPISTPSSPPASSALSSPSSSLSALTASPHSLSAAFPSAFSAGFADAPLGNEGYHPDYSKSFVIGSAIFNILVGLKPRSFSPEFPIAGEIQAKLVKRHEEHAQAILDWPIDEKRLSFSQ
ncbi:hypothetical protein Scep_009900 [Stephania cephalantha]|uniref:Uncharacterized protein n=1 Tax=Stephania cephalantha TaxID=152367 RepID=A0AAP0JUP9_9MAGN